MLCSYWLQYSLKKETVNSSIDLLKKSPKQKEILLHIISEIKSNSYLKIKDLKDKIKFSDSSLKGLDEKGFISIKKLKIDRNDGEQKYDQNINELSGVQSKALNQIKDQLTNKDVVLLDGVTSSGKTEIYIKLIES